MSVNLPPETLYDFITGDFEDAWNSVAWNPSARNRGNFMFARQAMGLLEFISRLCWSDSSNATIADFSKELAKLESRYFTKLPGFVGDFDEFDLPFLNSKGDELLWAVFDLIRNGQAHQYQQIVVDLSGGKQWAVSLTGAELGRPLHVVQVRPRLPEFLGYSVALNQVFWLTVNPERVYLDLKKASENSKLLSRGLSFNYLTRPRQGSARPKTLLTGQKYNFTLSDLEASLVAGGHLKL
jgi:hypothetical protein